MSDKLLKLILEFFKWPNVCDYTEKINENHECGYATLEKHVYCMRDFSVLRLEHIKSSIKIMVYSGNKLIYNYSMEHADKSAIILIENFIDYIAAKDKIDILFKTDDFNKTIGFDGE